MKEGRSGIIAVDLVDPTMAPRLQQSGAIQKLSQQHRTSWPVNSCQPSHNPPSGESDSLGLQKDPTSFTIRHGWRYLGHPTSISLGVNRRASGKNNMLRLEGGEKMGQTIAINSPVGLGSTLARTGTMDHQTRTQPLRGCGKWLRNIDRHHGIRPACEIGRGFFRSTETKNAPSRFKK